MLIFMEQESDSYVGGGTNGTIAIDDIYYDSHSIYSQAAR
jgi:hypothetical protein